MHKNTLWLGAFLMAGAVAIAIVMLSLVESDASACYMVWSITGVVGLFGLVLFIHGVLSGQLED